MYGPPGTGKTLLARCLAAESGANFVHVRATDVASKWYGEAERRLQSVFDQGPPAGPRPLLRRDRRPLARHREESHEATHRVVSTLLENMDGLEESKGIVVIAATNRPEVVDGALTRPGRFDRLVEVPLPTAPGAGHLPGAPGQGGAPGRAGALRPIDQDGWEQLLDVSEGFSGAEIEETVRRVLEAKVRRGPWGCRSPCKSCWTRGRPSPGPGRKVRSPKSQVRGGPAARQEVLPLPYRRPET